MPGFSPWAIRRVQDCHLSFSKPGLKVYLRVKNAEDSSMDYVRLGFQWSPTGAQATGYTDILIQPPPDVVAVSANMIGVSGGRLTLGANHFIISHTFVLNRMATMGYTDARQVFRDKSVIGFVYDRRIFAIEDLLPDSISDQHIRWDVTANMVEEIISQ